jgi:hypothetical protein
MSADHAGSCQDCGSPLDRDQRYCLSCGARVGPRSPQLAELLRRVNDRGDARPTSTATHATDHRVLAPGPGLAPGLRLVLPPAKVSALLVLVFLAFGVILGGAAGSRVDDTLAASARRLKVVLPQPSPPAGSASASASGLGSGSGSAASPRSEPPASEPEPTPAPAAVAGSSSPPAKAPPTSSASRPAPAARGEGGSSGSRAGGSNTKLPPVKHVFVLMLSDAPYAAVFGPASSARYLSQTLEHQGELLVRYDAVAHEELANGVALLSGQGPTVETAGNCPTYSDIAPATIGAQEQVLGSGCVYPKATQTLAGQLAAKHLSWRAYVQGIDEAGTPAPACAHPVLGAPDPTAAQTPTGGSYATFRNPFVYFSSLTGTSACAADDVGLGALRVDLANAKRTPSFSYIVPDGCHDGSPTPCAAGAPSGLLPADGLLKQIVPEITGSKAYKEGGLLVITVDGAPSSGEFADSSSCCGQPQFPNLPSSSTGQSPRGGGTVGALLLSPFVRGATTNQEPYSHFSLLRTIEDLYGLKHLGYAALPKVGSFEASIFSAYTPR